MSSHLRGRAVILLAGLALAAASDAQFEGSDAAPRSPDAPSAPSQPCPAFARLPIRFEQNDGQLDARAKFVARSDTATVFLTDEGPILALPAGRRPEGLRHRPGIRSHADCSPLGADTAVALRLVGARPVAPQGSGLLVTRSNYLRGASPSQWRTNVPNYARVTYPAILAGVDLVFHGEDGALEYDFVVAPGAETDRLALELVGSTGVSLTTEGALSIGTSSGTLLQPRPLVYQMVDGSRRVVEAAYRLKDETHVGFTLASYDRSRELVIDPTIAYATYLGGNGDDAGTSIAVDASGSAYIAGMTTSLDFPTMDPLQQKAGSCNKDAFVAKLSPSGSELLYATYLGGHSDDGATGIAVDGAGNAYVTGTTESTDFPLQNALDPTLGASQDPRNYYTGGSFVSELAPSGASLVYSTYLGGHTPNAVGDVATGIAVDAQGNAYVAGWTGASDFPAQAPLFAWNPGAPGELGVYHGFVTEIAAAGTSFVYSTFLGGSGFDAVSSIAIDRQGRAYVSGSTTSADFPVKGAFDATFGGGVPLGPSCPSCESDGDAFVTALSSGGSSLVYSTFLGGSGDDQATSIATDPAGNAYVVGATASPDFPTKSAIYGPSPDAGVSQGSFATKFTASGSVVYSTYFPGVSGVAADATGSAYLVGDFPYLVGDAGALGGDLVELTATGALASETALKLGGVAQAIAVNAPGSVYLTGGVDYVTDITEFPFAAVNAICAQPPAGSNAFVAWLAPTAVSLDGGASGGACPAPTDAGLCVTPLPQGLPDPSQFGCSCMLAQRRDLRARPWTSALLVGAVATGLLRRRRRGVVGRFAKGERG